MVQKYGGIRVEIVSDVVVTLATDRSLQLEHIDPRSPWEPCFLVDDPTSSERPEVTPAVVRMEA